MSRLSNVSANRPTFDPRCSEMRFAQPFNTYLPTVPACLLRLHLLINRDALNRSWSRKTSGIPESPELLRVQLRQLSSIELHPWTSLTLLG